MAESKENYVSLLQRSELRSQAIRVFAVLLAIVGVWLLLIVGAPLLAAGDISISGPIYSFFGNICHQMPDRSFHLLEHKLAVCSRCFGVYVGLLAGLLLYMVLRKIDDVEPLPRIWLFAAMIPVAIDWSLGVFGIWENNHASRFITGLILGAACAVYIVPAAVEIIRNFFPPKVRTQ